MCNRYPMGASGDPHLGELVLLLCDGKTFFLLAGAILHCSWTSKRTHLGPPSVSLVLYYCSKLISNVTFFLKSKSSHSLLCFYGDLPISLYWKILFPAISYNNLTFNSPHLIVSPTVFFINT